MRPGLHHQLCASLVALLVAAIVAMALPAPSGDHGAIETAQMLATRQVAPHLAEVSECHAGGCPAVQLKITLSTVFAANTVITTPLPATLTVPDSYHSALDTPPPRT